ncbi:hypothetical protein C8Q73DRAFT_295048 [Cubamyces lactineus]|nr:hypothetical protein C8Q73DRAFT_295048 [Cubamyces lactineus]
MAWNPRKRRSPAQRAHVQENLRRIHSQQQNSNIENIPPLLSNDAAPLETLTPLRHLHSANEKLAEERRKNEVQGRKLRNALLREGRLRNSKDGLKATLEDVRAEQKAGEVIARAEIKAARTKATQAEARAQKADVEMAEVEAKAAAATARAVSAEDHVRVAEVGRARAEAWAQAAGAQEVQAKEEARAACVRADAAAIAMQTMVGRTQVAEAQAQAADVHAQRVAAEYSEAFRGLAVSSPRLRNTSHSLSRTRVDALKPQKRGHVQLSTQPTTRGPVQQQQSRQCTHNSPSSRREHSQPCPALSH